MELSVQPFHLNLKYPFGVSGHTRTQTPVIYVKLSQDKISGYGEASLPPYLGLTQDVGLSFLNKVNVNDWHKKDIETIHAELNKIESGCTAIKAALDIAWHDWYGKANGISMRAYYNQKENATPEIGFTIGIDTIEVISKKIQEASDFNILKVKLGSEDDYSIIKTLRSVTDKPYYVDANQGWKDLEWAKDFSSYLKENNCLLIEQPFRKENLSDTLTLSKYTPLPIILDEGFQRFEDLDKIKGSTLGVNIKLMKCTGLYEANRIIDFCKKENIKLFMGCMNESSCATAAELILAPFCDYTDLDGPWLITNDPFEKPKIKNGRILINDFPGLGLSTNLF